MRTLKRMVLAALAMLVPVAVSAQDGLYDRPTLAIDAGMHGGTIRRADMDAAGRYAVTGSHDKTVKLWDARTGALLDTLPMPRGPGTIGKVFAVAIDPAGETVAAGGWTSSSAGKQKIYLFSRATGEMIVRIDGLPNVVNHLAFSPDGRFLVATLGAGGMRVHDRALGWAETARDEEYGGRSYGAAFAPDGRLATTGYDGKIRVYRAGDFRLDRVVETGGRPFDIAFDPDGRRLAVGFDDAPRVLLYDAVTLDPMTAPDLAGVGNGNLASVAFDAAGTLHAGGRYVQGGQSPVLRWNESGAEREALRPGNGNTVTSLTPTPDGGLLVAAADPFLARLGPQGRPLWRVATPLADFRGQRHTFGVSADGSSIGFGFAEWGEEPATFSLRDLRLRQGADPSLATPEQGRLAVTDWVNRIDPKLDGSPLALELYETSRSLAIHPDGGRFVLGADWSLRAFDAGGTALWREPAPGVVWAVTISGDGRFAIAAYADGTIRWHRMEDGRELLAFMPFTDRRSWVAWTPEGYFVAEGEARDALRWVVNHGFDRVADMIPVAHIGGFERADVVSRVLDAEGTPLALGLATLARDRERVKRALNASSAPGAHLHVLTIGVSEYRHGDIDLDYADDDAQTLKALLKRQGGLAYAEVHATSLIDGEATAREIKKAFGQLGRRLQSDQGDVAVIHLSGHAAQAFGETYFLPHDAEADIQDNIVATGLAFSTIRAMLTRLGERARVVVLLDACHSGDLLPGAKSLSVQPDMDALRQELISAGTGVAVLTSSSGKELSFERREWGNGAFTKAITEALNGRADANTDGFVSMSELESYVYQRVRELTDGAQTPRRGALTDNHYETRLFAVAGAALPASSR